jgi:hypothetical protein
MNYFQHVEYRSKASSSIIALPYHEIIADNNRVCATVTGETKVIGMCYSHGIFTEQRILSDMVLWDFFPCKAVYNITDINMLLIL